HISVVPDADPVDVGPEDALEPDARVGPALHVADDGALSSTNAVSWTRGVLSWNARAFFSLRGIPRSKSGKAREQREMVAGEGGARNRKGLVGRPRAWQPLRPSAILPSTTAPDGRGRLGVGRPGAPFLLEGTSAHVRLPLRPMRAHLRGAAAHLRVATDDMRSLRRPDSPTPRPSPVHPEGWRLVRHRLSLRGSEEGDGGREEVERRGFHLDLDDERHGRRRPGGVG